MAAFVAAAAVTATAAAGRLLYPQQLPPQYQYPPPPRKPLCRPSGSTAAAATAAASVFLPRGRPFRTSAIDKTQGFFAPHTGPRAFSTLGTPGKGCQRLQASQPLQAKHNHPSPPLPPPLLTYPRMLLCTLVDLRWGRSDLAPSLGRGASTGAPSPPPRPAAAAACRRAWPIHRHPTWGPEPFRDPTREPPWSTPLPHTSPASPPETKHAMLCQGPHHPI